MYNSAAEAADRRELERHFGKLTVVEPASGKDSHLWVLCKCDCGGEKTVRMSDLRTGKIKSCGCLWRTCGGEGGKGHHSPEWRSWSSMLRRCYDIKHRWYSRYGGRGITVCEEWRTSFVAFLRDMGRRPSLGYSLDRKNNDLGYFVENCRWATQKEQANNRDNTVTVQLGDETISASELSSRTGIKRDTLRWRLSRGFSTERLLSMPSPRRKHAKESA